MANDVFIQRGNFGRRIFLLQEKSLEITITTVGASSKVEFPLKSISPDYSVHSRIMKRFFLVPMAVATMLLFAFCMIAGFRVVSGWIVFYGLAFATAFIVAAAKGLKPVEYFNFYNHSKKTLFSVVRERGQEEDCNNFVARLIDRIEQRENGITVDKHEALRATKTYSIALPSADEKTPKSYWGMAFIAAVIGITYPPIEAIAEKEALFGFIVALGGVTCAIAASLASFYKREPQKYWTLIAVALSFLPFAIY